MEEKRTKRVFSVQGAEEIERLDWKCRRFVSQENMTTISKDCWAEKHMKWHNITLGKKLCQQILFTPSVITVWKSINDDFVFTAVWLRVFYCWIVPKIEYHNNWWIIGELPRKMVFGASCWQDDEANPVRSKQALFKLTGLCKKVSSETLSTATSVAQGFDKQVARNVIECQEAANQIWLELPVCCLMTFLPWNLVLLSAFSLFVLCFSQVSIASKDRNILSKCWTCLKYISTMLWLNSCCLFRDVEAIFFRSFGKHNGRLFPWRIVLLATNLARPKIYVHSTWFAVDLVCGLHIRCMRISWIHCTNHCFCNNLGHQNAKVFLVKQR